VLSVVLINMSEEGNLEALAALGTVLLALTVAIVAVAWSLLGRDALFTEPMRGGPRS
jgi:iron(III) transport system permease protein